MPFYAYVLINSFTDKLYKGHCADLQSRLREHWYGHTRSTKIHRREWKLGYFEEFETRKEAIAREKYFKTAAGRRFLKDKISRLTHK